MKNQKPSGFFWFIAPFLCFFQNLNFLNYNWLIFDEPKKPIRTGFISFQEKSRF
jgi:hypothetical protein